MNLSLERTTTMHARSTLTKLMNIGFTQLTIIFFGTNIPGLGSERIENKSFGKVVRRKRREKRKIIPEILKVQKNVPICQCEFRNWN